MMPVCFLPYDERKKTNNHNVGYRYIFPTKIICSIKKENLIELIINLLKSNKEINIFGYNAKYNEIWCKNIKRNNINIHLNIHVNYIDNCNTEIIITPILANDLDINKMLINIKKLVKLNNKK